jgi:UDP-glucose 4-epimerase
LKVLVTGGSGFIGSHVVDKLRARGVHVRIFDMVTPQITGPGIEFYHGSLLDLEAVRMAIDSRTIDAVYHLAAIADVKDVYEEPYYSESINVRGTINVLEAMRRSGTKRLVYGSTIWVYSDVEQDVVDETTPLHAPSHLYTATKIASEYYCQSYAKLYGLECTILRYGIPYGPRARAGAVIPILVDKALRGEPLTIAGDGLQYRRFVYVEDLADANVLALKSVAKNKIYNLDGTERITIRQIVETIQKVIGGVKVEQVAGRPGDFGGKEVSSERAKRELGWEAITPFEEGLRRYITWFKERSESRAEGRRALEQLLS